MSPTIDTPATAAAPAETSAPATPTSTPTPAPVGAGPKKPSSTAKKRVATQAAPKPKPKPAAKAKPVAASSKPRPAAKAAAKAAAKPAAKAAAKPQRAAPPPVAAGGQADEAPRKRAKLVRDSFTMPQFDFDLIDALKARTLGLKRTTKKSELLRAGLHALAGLKDRPLLAALDSLQALKPGRPKKLD